MFGDRMQQKDGIGVNLECGHPNVKSEEQCPLCGVWLQRVAVSSSTEGHDWVLKQVKIPQNAEPGEAVQTQGEDVTNDIP